MGNSGGWDWSGDPEPVPVQDEENSIIAARSVQGIHATRLEHVWLLVREQGPMTEWEAEPILGRSHQSVSPNFTWLRQHHRIVTDGKKPAPSGRPTWIWRAITRDESDALEGRERPSPLPPGSPPVSPLREEVQTPSIWGDDRG